MLPWGRQTDPLPAGLHSLVFTRTNAFEASLILRKQQALEMLTDSYELLDRVKEIIASKVARSMLNLGSEDRGARGIQYAFGGSPHSHLPVCQL